MTITGTLHDCTIGLLFAVMSVGTLTDIRVISLTVERHVDHSDNRQQLQCCGPSAEDSHQAQESRT